MNANRILLPSETAKPTAVEKPSKTASSVSCQQSQAANNHADAVRVIPWYQPFDPGELVHIFQIAVFRRPFIEGRAVIVAPTKDAPGIYYVQFEHEARLRRRIVLPGVYQTEPDQTLDTLLTAWRVSPSAEIRQEFFLDEITPDNENEES